MSHTIKIASLSLALVPTLASTAFAIPGLTTVAPQIPPVIGFVCDAQPKGPDGAKLCQIDDDQGRLADAAGYGVDGVHREVMVNRPQSYPNCDVTQLDFYQNHQYYLTVKHSVCWDASHVDNQEQFELDSPTVGSYSAKIGLPGGPWGTLEVRFADAHGNAAPVENGWYGTNGSQFSIDFAGDIVPRFAAQLQQASYFDGILAALVKPSNLVVYYAGQQVLLKAWSTSQQPLATEKFALAEELKALAKLSDFSGLTYGNSGTPVWPKPSCFDTPDAPGCTPDPLPKK